MNTVKGKRLCFQPRGLEAEARGKGPERVHSLKGTN